MTLLAGTIQLDRSCWLDLLSQELRPSLVTGLVLARASLTPRLAKESAAPSLPSQLNRPGLAGTMQLDRSCLLDLLSQELRPSLVTGLVLARASLTPRLAEESAAPSLPSQRHRSGSALSFVLDEDEVPARLPTAREDVIAGGGGAPGLPARQPASHGNRTTGATVTPPPSPRTPAGNNDFGAIRHRGAPGSAYEARDNSAAG